MIKSNTAVALVLPFRQTSGRNAEFSVEINAEEGKNVATAVKKFMVKKGRKKKKRNEIKKLYL